MLRVLGTRACLAARTVRSSRAPTKSKFFLCARLRPSSVPLSINPYLIGEKQQRVILPSPPPPPPPAVAPEAAPVYDEVAVPPAYTAAIPGVVSGRKLLASSTDAASSPGPTTGECTVYYRTMNFLTELVITATEPDTCGGGYCDNNTWTYALAPTCSETYRTVNVPISAAQYSADVADGFSWCSSWWETVPSGEVPSSTMYLRSSADPYVLAGAMTNCSYAFDQASEEYANAGFFFLVVRPVFPCLCGLPLGSLHVCAVSLP